MNYLTNYYKNLSEQLQEQINKLERQILTEAPRRQSILPGSMPNIMQQLNMPEFPQMPAVTAPQQPYIPQQMAPNFIQPGNNPQQPQQPQQPQFNVPTAGIGVGIPGVNVEGPAVPQYVPPQNAPNYVQPGNNPQQPQQWSVVNAGRGTTPNKYAQFAGGITKALDDVRRGIMPTMPQQQQSSDANTGKVNAPSKYAQFAGGITKALDDVRRGIMPTMPQRQGVTPQSDIDDYLKTAGQQSGTRINQVSIPAGDPNNPSTYMPGSNVQTSKRPSAAEFNQAAMEPGGVYQMDKSGYVQSYLPANQQRNEAPVRNKQQPAQQQQQQSQSGGNKFTSVISQQPAQQSDNYQPVTGEYWKSPTERVVPGQQKQAPAQQQQPVQQQQQPVQQQSQQQTKDALAQYGAQQFAQQATNLAFGGIFNNPQQQAQPQNYGAFGMKGQSPEQMDAYNRLVNSKKK